MLYCVWHTPTETSHSSVFDVIRRTGHVSPVVANDATGYYNLNITAHDWHARTQCGGYNVCSTQDVRACVYRVISALTLNQMIII